MIGKRVIIVVAHADDEALNAAGLMARHRGFVDFTVLLCAGFEKHRVEEFYAACKYAAASPAHFELVGHFKMEEHKAELQKMLHESIDWSTYDTVITHSFLGELNQNPDHKAVHQCVVSALKGAGYAGGIGFFGMGTHQNTMLLLSKYEQGVKEEMLSIHKSQKPYLEDVLLNGLTPFESFYFLTSSDLTYGPELTDITLRDE